MTREEFEALRNRVKTSENLPVLETVILEPEGVDLQRYRHIGEEVTYTVEIQASKLYRKEIVQPKYGQKS